MIFYIFDLSIATKSQVFNIIREMRDQDLTGGIYLWVNQVSRKMYVGSTMNFYARIASYFYLTRVTRVILRALNKYGFSSFTLILVFVPKASRELTLLLEQHVLDNWVCDYNCQPNATSAGRSLTAEHKAKISEAIGEGMNHHRYNGGFPIYLYKVNSQGLELAATFPNLLRASETLNIPRTTLHRYMKARTLFQLNGISHIISKKAKPSL